MLEDLTPVQHVSESGKEVCDYPPPSFLPFLLCTHNYIHQLYIFCYFAEDAEIVNNFFAGRQSSSELVVTARSDGLRTFIPTLAPIDATGTVIDDRSQLVDGVAIGCRASGRPKADISWFRTLAGGPRQEINTSLPNFNVTSSRAGESRLTVGLDSGDVDCYVYICVAENGGGPVEGSVQICPQRK